MEKLKNPENIQENRIRFINVINDGKKWFSFVVCPKESTHTNFVLYAWLNDLTGTTHTTIFNLAVEDLGFNEKYEPIGGGVINSQTRELQDSIHYGGIDDPEIIKAIRHKSRSES
jgi:hypothetical protein